MLRFGGLKYKKLNNTSVAEGDHEPSIRSRAKAPAHGMGPQQQRLHNQLNGSSMKNVNSPASSAMSVEAGKGLQPATTAHFRLLGGKFSIDSKRKSNCKARIYKCIKRILKRNTFGSATQTNATAPKDHRGTAVLLQQSATTTTTASRPLVPMSFRTSSPDYREIKTLLEKQNRKLEYDVNLAKCVEKPAFIKKIALNLLQTAVADGAEDSALVLQREHESSSTGAIQSDLQREREYQRLLGESWYHENLPRNLSLELLTDKLPGNFLVRKSTTQPDCYALSLRVPPGSGTRIAHYLIVRTASDGYKIKGFQKEFTSLRALIVHHSVMPEALPVPLSVPRPADLVVKTKFEDDYETVFDLTHATKH
ncbi:protein sprint-like isoform X1 [Anopheles bellator]|uniref:protein sprint-like isoform X1 n=2 Tax=Anopheles bellator TaxID=139047 RepID=UPI00264998FA|nr:protein sprint-like isoform X1 [Anopheles bellator]